jgi:hypothetical protein
VITVVLIRFHLETCYEPDKELFTQIVMAYQPVHGKNSVLAAVVLVIFTLLGGLGEPAQQNHAPSKNRSPPPKAAPGVKPLVVNPGGAAVKGNVPKPTTSSAVLHTLDFVPHQDNDTSK